MDISNFPLFLVDGFPLSGCSTLSSLIANTYSLELVDGNHIIRQLFEQSPYFSGTATALEKEKKFAEFIQKELVGTPIIEKLFGFLAEKIKAAKKPLLINISGIIGYCIAKKITPLYQLFVQCEATERANRIYRAIKQTPSLDELNQMVETLLQQDNFYTTAIHNRLAIVMLHDEPEYHINFVNSTEIEAEKLSQKVTSEEAFVKAYAQVQKLLPEIGQEWTRWKCLVCGYVYEGQKPLTVCPRCKNADPDKFGDVG